ncbi:MAG: DUF6491 family protein [Pseudohongiellaceae bacterium]
MQRAIPFLGLVMAALFLGACAGTEGRGDVDQVLEAEGLERGGQITSIRNYQVNGWSAINAENLIITTGVNNDYLVELMSPCLGLQGATTIGFTSTAGNLDRFEDIVVQSPGIGTERCPIETITELRSGS